MAPAKEEEGEAEYDVLLLRLRPSRVRGVPWNVPDASWDRMLTGCGEEEDWHCWAEV